MESLWSKNVIVVDAAYLDKVAFNLIVNFERMLGRAVPQGDLARWAECAALDGGVRGEDNSVQVILVHSDGFSQFANMSPSLISTALNGMAFGNELGEFTFHSLTGADISTVDEVLTDLVGSLSREEQVDRIIVVPDSDNMETVRQLRTVVQDAPEGKHITLLAMQPTLNGNYRQEMLGYSLLQALGISSQEIDAKME